MIQLWELRGREDRRYSLFSWRTRMALRHKGLEFKSTPVAMGDKAAIAFSGGSPTPPSFWILTRPACFRFSRFQAAIFIASRF